jgi:hypothetical protein
LGSASVGNPFGEEVQMARIQIRRQPVAYLVAVAAVLTTHAWLSYPAAVARGYPPMEVWEFLPPFVAPFWMAVPPLFDDGRKRPKMRIGVIAVTSVAFALVWAIIAANGTVRPSTGHLAGVTGILKYHPFEVIFGTLMYMFPAFLFSSVMIA